MHPGSAISASPALVRQNSRRIRSSWALAVVYGAFIVTGVVTSLLGPILPMLQAGWRLSDQRAGYLFTAQFAASVVGALWSGRLIPRYGFRIPLIGGYALMAVGIGFLGFASWPASLVAVAGEGMALGLVIPASNLLISESSPSRRAAALSLLNFAWGVGAVACPLLAARVRQDSDLPGFLLTIAASAALATVLLCGLQVELPSRARPDHSRVQVRDVWRRPLAFLLALLFFLYVGTEAAVGGWVADYTKRIAAGSAGWIFTPSFFWAGLMLGRAAAPVFLRRIRDCNLAMGGLALAFGSVLMLILCGSLRDACGACALAGMGLASVFPVTIAQLSKLGAAGQRVSGAMFALAGLGGTCLPWLVGYVSTHAGSLKAGLAVPLTATVAMLVSFRFLKDAGASSQSGVAAQVDSAALVEI